MVRPRRLPAARTRRPAGRLLLDQGASGDATSDPALGEIYVIATDPDYAGIGLGRALTLAGLDHLARAGLGVGMLHVEGDNTAAVALYDKLGFTSHSTHRWWAPEAHPHHGGRELGRASSDVRGRGPSLRRCRPPGSTSRATSSPTSSTGEPRYRVDQVWRGLYEQRVEPVDMTSLPKALRARLTERAPARARAGDRESSATTATP